MSRSCWRAGYLWRWFWELDGCRAAGFAGLLPISYVELDAWSRLTGATPDVAEVAMLKAMDRARLAARASRLCPRAAPISALRQASC